MATSSTSSRPPEPRSTHRAGRSGAVRTFATLLLIGASLAVMARDEFGIDRTLKPKVLPGTCGVPVVPAGTPPIPAPGIVEVTATVDADGAVIDLRLTRSSGWPALDQAVLTAYRSCQFQPAIQNRVPVAGERELHFEWTPPSPAPAS